ncbi:MAG: glycosyltransferase family 4 protein [Actinobacteria bacterium]|nr:glycosyltransferase family 4 protein [Actinomycetota bacterium]MBI3687854.1 glycosyltransferase family 4 protein [Actinomycetota bacterium]
MTRLAILVEQCLAPVPGGTGRYSRELAAALAATAPPGSDVTGWVARHPDTAAARIPGVSGPRSLPLARRPLVLAWQRGLGPAPRDADVVHAPTLLLPPRRGRALVVTVHDTVPWTHPETLTPRGVAWHRQMAGRAARSADRIVVPTRAVAEQLAEVLPAVADRLVVVGEGVSGDLAVPADAERRARRLGLPAGGYLLSLATLEPRKGLDVLLAALAGPDGPDLPLVVVGQPGWGGVDPRAEATRIGLPATRLLLLGRVSDADLAVVLARATTLAVPSRAEGFGLPVLEAMAAGVPVVSSDVPALVEVAAGATVVVPGGDSAALAAALVRVSGDGALRAALIDRGRRRAADFTWTGAAAALWCLYGELVG